MLKIYELFSGIGAVKQASENIQFGEVKRTCDGNAKSNITYALLHHYDEFHEFLDKNPYIPPQNGSLDGRKISKMKSKSPEFLKGNQVAAFVNSNIPNNVKNIHRFDLGEQSLVHYSYPCQGLSVAAMGRAKGTLESDSTSNLVGEIERILKNLDPRDRPKYLTMENVPTLTTKFKNEFDLGLQALDNLGYKNIWFILNGIDFGSIQKRKRLFVISIKKTFGPFGNKTNEQIKEMFMKRYAKPLTFDERKKKWDFIFSASSDKEKAMKVLNNTKYQRKMVKECKDLSDGEPNNYEVGTILTGQDKIPNIGLIKCQTNDPNQLPMRPITYREALLLMGFPNSKIDRLNVLIEKQMASRNDFIKMAGNSLCVEVYEAILKFIRDLEK